MASSAEGARPHRLELDGLRAVAIVMVLWHHGTLFLIADHAGQLPLGGFLGVDVFFVLSGFLITTLLIEEQAETGTVSLRRFYGRRVRRLLPALMVLLALHAVVSGVLGRDGGIEARTTLAALSYTSNWGPTFGWHLAPQQIHLWSLAIEAQFYLVWPLVLPRLLRLGTGRLFTVLLGAIGAIAAWRVLLTHHYGTGYPIVHLRTDTRADTLLIGAGLALALHRGFRPSVRAARRAGWVGAAFLLFAFVQRDSMSWLYLGGFTAVALASAAVILSAVAGHGAVATALRWTPAVLVGQLSYSLYLWHLTAYDLTVRAVGGPGLRWLLVGVAVSMALAAASYTLIERPFRDPSARRAAEPGRRRAVTGRRVIPIAALGMAAMGLAVGGAAAAARERAADQAGGGTSAAAGSPVAIGADPGRVASSAAAEAPVGGGAGPSAEPSAPASVPAAPPSTAPPLLTTTLTVSAPAVVPAGPSQLTVSLAATLRDGQGGPIAGEPVRLRVTSPSDATECTAVTGTQGIAACSVALGGAQVDPVVELGTGLTVRSDYLGSAVYAPSTGTWAPG